MKTHGKGKMKEELKERITRVILLQKRNNLESSPLSDYEKICLEFYNYLKSDGISDFMWEDEWLKSNFKSIVRFSLSDETILLIGKSGAGKEIISRFIHYLSKRKKRNFHAINCSSFNDEMLYSELFGHEKGAYTGADRSREGILKTSDGGTVFLDEIQASSHKFQYALLRFLDYKEIRPLGSDRIKRADVRIIVACSDEPEKLLKKGKFIEPFYHRISGLQLYIPSLRERKDLEKYIYYFLLKECHRLGKEEKEISIEALEALIKYPWPGNLREMKKIIHSLILLNEDKTIELEALPKKIKNYKKETIIHSRLLSSSEKDFTRWRSYEIFLEMKEREKSFWEVVHKAYLNRKLNVYQLKEIIKFALEESGGKLKDALPIFRIKEKDYKKLKDFLRNQGIKIRDIC